MDDACLQDFTRRPRMRRRADTRESTFVFEVLARTSVQTFGVLAFVRVDAFDATKSHPERATGYEYQGVNSNPVRKCKL